MYYCLSVTICDQEYLIQISRRLGRHIPKNSSSIYGKPLSRYLSIIITKFVDRSFSTFIHVLESIFLVPEVVI